MVSVVIVGVLALGAVIGGVAANGNTREAKLHPASLSQLRHPARVSALKGSAASGGRVIVVLKKTSSKLTRAHGLAQRLATDSALQAPVVKNIKRSGGTKVRKLTLINAVAADVSAKEAHKLATLGDVAEVVPDTQVTQSVPITPEATNVAAPGAGECPAKPNKPLVEPEALQTMHFEGTGSDEADKIANGAGVTVAIEGMNEVAGNPNFTRADGTHVVIDAPDYNPADVPNDPSLDEWFGDASSVAAQGTVTYDYSSELPFSGLPSGCTFVIQGDAPGANLIDLSLVDPSAQITTVDGIETATITQSTSQIIAGIQNAALQGADVISESLGQGGGGTLLATADDAAVQAGMTVVASSGDEGFDNTFASPADDPNVIGVAGTTTLRLEAQAYGFPSWASGQIATLSSSGVGQPFSEPSSPGKLPDVAAPGYGGEAACSPLVTSSCPTNALTEAFGGTSESAPFVAGAAADVIEAYSNTHNGERPTPAMVKEIIDGSATDIDAPGGEQGAGQVNIYQAVLAAEQMPNSTAKGASPAPTLLSTPTQLDVNGAGGTKVATSLSVYNASTKATTVTAQLRKLGPATQLAPTVTENVSAPDPTLPVPAEGAQAAAPITFNVPAGVDHLSANMIWPDPTNSNILYYILTDPEGRLTQISYDFGTGSTRPGVLGSVPNIQHTEVNDPMPGTWTAQILWGNGRSHLQEPPNVPGTYTGPMSFQVTGQSYVTSSVGAGSVKIPAQSSGTVDVKIPLATAPGDNESSIQLAGSNGALASVPVLARTVVPPTGGTFKATMGTTVGRNQGSPNSLFFIDVPAGQNQMSVSFKTADPNADNSYTYELFNPSGQEVVADATPTTTLQGIGSTTPTALGNLSVANPAAGRWLIVVQLNLTTSGQEFSQIVKGNVTFNDSGVVVDTPLPDSASTTLALGSTKSILLEVTNTTGVGRTFTFSSSQAAPADIAPMSTYIAAGVTKLVTLQLVPNGTVGSVVTGNLTVANTTSAPAPRPGRTATNVSTEAVIPYSYTVGPAAS